MFLSGFVNVLQTKKECVCVCVCWLGTHSVQTSRLLSFYMKSWEHFRLSAWSVRILQSLTPYLDYLIYSEYYQHTSPNRWHAALLLLGISMSEYKRNVHHYACTTELQEMRFFTEMHIKKATRNEWLKSWVGKMWLFQYSRDHFNFLPFKMPMISWRFVLLCYSRGLSVSCCP